jgi:hypothetical protein
MWRDQKACGEMSGWLEAAYASNLLKTVIPNDFEIDQALADGRPLFFSDAEVRNIAQMPPSLKTQCRPCAGAWRCSRATLGAGRHQW